MLKLQVLMKTVPEQDRAELLPRMGVSDTTWWKWRRQPHLWRALALVPLAEYFSAKHGKTVTVDELLKPAV